MKNHPILRIGKLDAARRQLETAAKLWFQDADPVSVHTLTAAAYKILVDVSKHRGNSPMLGTIDGLKGRIVPGKEKEFCDIFAKAQNFFKHADRDPEDVTEFRPGANQFMLWEACERHKELAGEKLPILEAMSWWFTLTHLDYFQFPEAQQIAIEGIRSSLIGEGKLAFFCDFLKMQASPSWMGECG